ncbi:MAG: hypothetical protein LBT05_16425 [Planctomycetaceae bacterium]|jgi:hypothetical protein|nr:hypothetical protein [Planctomycetaceae bacterium]
MEMHLSLKTLLAYKDRLFDEEYQAILKQRITEQDSAENLLQRIEIVSHDKKIGVPGRSEENEELPINIVAAYLDHQLSDTESHQFETICLQSDLFLAEAACVHEILTTRLGEPAQIGRECRLKLYAIPTFSQSKNTQIIENHKNAEIQKSENKLLVSEQNVTKTDQQTEPEIKQPPQKRRRIVVQRSNIPINAEPTPKPKTEEQRTRDVSSSNPVVAAFQKQESRLGQAFEKWKRRRQIITLIAVLLFLLTGGIIFCSLQRFQANETPQMTASSSVNDNRKPENNNANAQLIAEHTALWKNPVENFEENKNENSFSESMNYFSMADPVYALPEPPSQVAQYLSQYTQQKLPPNFAAETSQNSPKNTSSVSYTQNFNQLPPTENPLLSANFPQNVSHQNPYAEFPAPLSAALLEQQPEVGTAKPPLDVYVPQSNDYSSSALLSFAPAASVSPTTALGTTASIMNPTTVMNNSFIGRNSDGALSLPSVSDSRQVSIQIRDRSNVPSVSQSIYQTLPAVQPALSNVPSETRIFETNTPNNTNIRNPQQRSEAFPYRNGTSQQTIRERPIQQVAYHDRVLDELQSQSADQQSEDVLWNEMKDEYKKNKESNIVNNNDAFESIPLITPLKSIAANVPQDVLSENRTDDRKNTTPGSHLPSIREPRVLTKNQEEIAAEIFLANDDLALIRETPESNWVWLPVSKPLYQDIILIPAPFRATIRFSNGILIETEGDTRIKILPPDERRLPGIAFDCGHLTISAKGESGRQADIQSASYPNAKTISPQLRMITPVGSGVLRLTDRNSYVCVNSENKTAIKLLRVIREYRSVTENPQFYNANLNENVMYCPNLLAFPIQGQKIFWKKDSLTSGQSSAQTGDKNSEEWELTSPSIFPLDEEKSLSPIFIADIHNIFVTPNVVWPSLTSHDGKIPITKLHLKNQFITMPETFFPTPSKTWLLK